MADFNQAIPIVLASEGGYVNNPADPGGETYKGISRVFHPSWDGWVLVDQDKSLGNFPAVMESDNDLQIEVRDFYYKYWSQFPGLQQVNSQDLANMFYDLSFPIGPAITRLLQSTILACGLKIAQDGMFGPGTTRAANTIFPGELIPAFGQDCIVYFQQKVAKDNSKKAFLKGWTNRVLKHTAKYQSQSQSAVAGA